MTKIKAREGEEVWQSTTGGTVWVSVTDDRGREREVSVGGKPGKILRIKTMDREVNQERIQNEGSDPFINGLLKRVDAAPSEEDGTASEQALSNEELLILFSKKSSNFQAAVDKLNEVNVRRLKDLAEAVDATQSQVAYIEETIEKKYRRHGDTRTYREMMQLGEVHS